MRALPMVGLLSLCACVTTAPTPPPPPLSGPVAGLPGGGAPLELALTRHTERTAWKLSDERGSVVLLDVWATWCEPCRDSLPMYQDLAKQFGSRGLKVYAISVDADPNLITPFLEENKVALPVLLDPAAAVAEETLRVRMMPTALLVDRAGVVRHVHEGFAEEYLQKYVTELEALLAEPAPK